MFYLGMLACMNMIPEQELLKIRRKHSVQASQQLSTASSMMYVSTYRFFGLTGTVCYKLIKLAFRKIQPYFLRMLKSCLFPSREDKVTVELNLQIKDDVHCCAISAIDDVSTENTWL